MSGRNQIFISYAHEDERWREIFEKYLGIFEETRGISVWTDKDIAPGARWHYEICSAIAQSRMALMLVSADFLHSDFIKSEELPRILEDQRRRGLHIRWVLLETVPIEELPLSHVQAVLPTNEPLKALEKDEAMLAETVTAIVREIRDVLIVRPGISAADNNVVPYPIAKRIEEQLEDFSEIGRGDYSVVFRAQRSEQPVALKVFGVEGHKDGIVKRFERPLDRAGALRHPAFIRIIDREFDADVPVVMMEYVEAPNLFRYLDEHGPMQADQAAQLLLQLACAFSEAHQARLIHGSLRPSNIFITDDGEGVRVSPVSMCSVMIRMERARGILTLAGNRMTFMPPEIYRGWSVGERIDQYSLGMIGLVMLMGKPPFRIRAPADFGILAEFYKGPMQWGNGTATLEQLKDFWFNDLRQNSPPLAVILRRLLSESPYNRFSSMQEVASNISSFLQQVARLPIYVEDAKSSYMKTCFGQDDFYRDFYDSFSAADPGIRELLDQKISKRSRHYQLLDDAITRLLNFRAGDEPTTLSRTADMHAQLGLTPVDFDHFRDAFLSTLKSRDVDEDCLDAWQATIRPGLDYMKSRLETANRAEGDIVHAAE